jgi:hypothetical protein
MLYFIAVWPILLLVATVVGLGVLSRLGRLMGSFADPFDRWIAAPWLGLLIWAVALLGVSVAVPLSPLVGLLVALALVLLAQSSGADRQALGALLGGLSLRHYGIGALLTVSVAALNSGPVTWADTGYYHYSVIQWLAQYGSVPGLALLFSNLGFTSAWFALAAPFSPIGIAPQVSAVANGAVTLLVLGQLGLCVARCWGRADSSVRLSDRFLLLFYGLLLPFILRLSPLAEIRVSPSPDYPVAMLVGLVAWAMLVVAQRPAPARADGLLPLVLAAGAVSLKLTALPLLGVASGFWLFCEWSSQRFSQPVGRDYGHSPQLHAGDDLDRQLNQSINQPIDRLINQSLNQSIGKPFNPLINQPFNQLSAGRSALIGLVFLGVMLSPLLIASLVTSGCPLYPSAVLCLDLPWSPTPQSVATTAANTHGWTTWYGAAPAGTNPWVWTVSQWLRTSRKQQITAGLLLAAILAAGYVVISQIWRSVRPARQLQEARSAVDRRLHPSATGQLWVAFLGLSGIVFLMLTSPFFRFSLPYIVLLLALLLAVVLPIGRPPNLAWHRRSKANRRVAGAVLAVVVLLFTMAQLKSRSATLLLPPPLPESVIVTKRVNDILYSAPASGDVPIVPTAGPSPHKDLCWAARLPCAFEVPDNVQLRDAQRGIAGGFVRR